MAEHTGISPCLHPNKGIASVPIINEFQSYRCPDCGVPVWFCRACNRGHALSEAEFDKEWKANKRPEVLTALPGKGK